MGSLETSITAPGCNTEISLSLEELQMKARSPHATKNVSYIFLGHVTLTWKLLPSTRVFHKGLAILEKLVPKMKTQINIQNLDFDQR